MIMFVSIYVALVTDYRQGGGIQMMEWPAYSPYLNLKEHLWDALERRLLSLHPPVEEFMHFKTLFIVNTDVATETSGQSNTPNRKSF